MNRRELLKALPAVVAASFMVGSSKITAYGLDPQARYLYFINEAEVNMDTFCSNHPGRLLPPGEVYAVRDVENAIRIYKVSK
jgi:hypothetical protein